MAQEKTCRECDKPRLPNQALCAEHRAKYMRDYRPTAKDREQISARNEGFTAGVQACVRYMRNNVGGSALTGYQAARDLEKHVVKADLDAIHTRNSLVIQSLRGM